MVHDEIPLVPLTQAGVVHDEIPLVPLTQAGVVHDGGPTPYPSRCGA